MNESSNENITERDLRQILLMIKNLQPFSLERLTYRALVQI